MRGRSVIVVGAGAAGTVAAIFAARSGARVLLIERTADGGRKILISGGGRCNILPSELAPERFVTESSPNTLRKILSSWPQREQRAFFERELGMRLVLEEETGKLFPETQRARDVRDRLYQRLRDAGGEFRFGCTVVGLTPLGRAEAEPQTEWQARQTEWQARQTEWQARQTEWQTERRADTPKGREEAPERGPFAPPPGWRVDVETAGLRESLHADSVVLATGGLSIPKTGSDGLGLEIARQLGHEIQPLYPALTPLTADPPLHADLAGIALPVTLRAPSARPRFETTDAFLFTHRGYSGPAVLDASHVAVRARARGARDEILVQWCPHGAEDWERIFLQRQGTLGAALAVELPNRLARQLVMEAGLSSDLPLARLPREARHHVLQLLTAYPLPWTGDEGYKKAEVTGGGVGLGEIDPRTTESRRHKGLFFCGEILDAFGPIGGHNFSWAWATGRLAGMAAGG